MKFIERYQVWLHIIGWAVFIGLPFLTLPDFVWNRQDLISIGMAQLLTSAFIITFFYINLRTLTPRLLRDQDTKPFLVVLMGMLLTVVLVKLACYYLFPPSFVTKDPNAEVRAHGPKTPWPFMLSTSISFSFAILVSSLMAVFRYHAKAREEQQQTVLEKVSAELAMLKLQVSPHFLFNTLNNIRWLARQKSDQTEVAVVALAQLLRYMIYQARQDRVPLRQEVQHLQHYIDLQKMRLTDNHSVTFNCEGNVDAYSIEPLLFIPFVENAFKHGFHGQKAGYIQIDLRVTGDKLIFRTENPADASTVAVEPLTQPGEDSGIGIVNIKQRLALHYPGHHTLQLAHEQNVFRVVLTLDLHHEKVALHRY